MKCDDYREVEVTINDKKFIVPSWFGKDYVIVSAKGHLYEPKPAGLRFVKTIDELPKSDIKWCETDNEARARLKVIKEIYDKYCSDVVVATDNDREGEVIGYSIAKYKLRLDLKDFKRAYFNALTTSEVLRAFDNLQFMSEKLLTQGIARAIADSIIGLNLSKALTLRFKEVYPEVIQAFSLGRVQSPVLYFIYNEFNENYINVNKDRKIPERDREIKYRERIIILEWKDYSIKVDVSLSTNTDKLKVKDIIHEYEEINQSCTLDNTNDVMIELGEKIEPNELMNILESMYLEGLSTYPRTESKGIPKEFAEELFDKLKQYIDLPDSFNINNSLAIREELKEGKYAITLTPEGIDAYFSNQVKGVKKYVATYLLSKLIRTFAPPVRIRKVILKLQDIHNESNVISLEWSKIVENIEEVIKGYYESIEREVPNIGDEFNVKIVEYEVKDKYRERYTFTGLLDVGLGKILKDYEIVTWMINEGLGTEATRQQYPVILRERHYITNYNAPTLIGEKIAEIISKIDLSPELTAEMENRIADLKYLDDLDDFKEWVVELTKKFIGKIKELDDDEFIFKCPKGHELKLMQTKKSKTLYAVCPICSKKFMVI